MSTAVALTMLGLDSWSALEYTMSLYIATFPWGLKVSTLQWRSLELSWIATQTDGNKEAGLDFTAK